MSRTPEKRRDGEKESIQMVPKFGVIEWCDINEPRQTASLKAVRVPFQFPEVVPLNIGGAHFTTRLSTLRRYEDTMLAAMFSGRHYIPTDSEGRYFIDRDGTHFGYVSSSAISSIVIASK